MAHLKLPLLARSHPSDTVRAVMTNDGATPAVQAASIAAAVKRLGKNLGGYFGECIDIEAVQAEQRQFAQAHGWQIEALVGDNGVNVPVFRRHVPRPARRLYISAGIHGDE